MPQSSTSRAPLRIGLLVDSYSQPQWVRRIISEISASSMVSIVLVVKNASGEKIKKGIFKRLIKRRKHLLYAAYTKLDERLAKVSPDAFEMVNVEDLLAGVPVVNVEPISQKFTDRLHDEDLELIKKYELDVAIRFGFRILKGEVLKIAKHGVWSYHHDDGLVYRGGPPGFWEVMTDDPVTGSMLQILNEELDNGRVIDRSWAPTVNRFSVKKNNNNYYWKTSAFMMRKLKELYMKGEIIPGRQELIYASQPYSRRLYRTPVDSEMLGLLTRLVPRAATRIFEKVAYRETWSLAYRFSSGQADFNDTFYNFKYLLPPRGRFWADPFPVKFNNRYFVFFEEFVYRKNKAHISVIELEKGAIPSQPVRVLERPYHLSYPFMFEWQGSYYMIPETGSNNTVELYRCKSFPDEWELDAVLLEANNPSDATLAEVDGRWWMFVNIEEPGVTVNWEELHLFYADSPLGPWTPHWKNPVRSNVRNSRPAGRLLYRENRLYRPAQDCSQRYGYATAINLVRQLNPEDYHEEEVSRITPDWDRKVIGTHTFNTAEDLTVIDCLIRESKLSSRPREIGRAQRRQTVAPRENVLQLIHSFIQGGSERQMIQLSKLLVDSGRYRVNVACLNPGGALRSEVDSLGFGDIREYPLTSFYDRNMLVQLRRFGEFLKENDIRLVHTHDFYSNIFGMAGAALVKFPVRVASRRDTGGMGRSPAQKVVERLAFRWADEVIANAEAVKDQLVREGVTREKISVIYNGLDLKRLAPSVRTRAEVLALLGLPCALASPGHKFVTIVANMQHDVKDHPMFLRVAQRVCRAMPETYFLLAGEGRLIESLRALAEELGIEGRTFFLGRCKQVPELLSISDVCVLSSKAEGFSNSILEYMAAGRPVVATDVGGAREAIVDGKTGYIVPPGDDEAMADRILALLGDPELMHVIGERAQCAVKEHFSLEKQLLETLALYERLLQRKNGAGA